MEALTPGPPEALPDAEALLRSWLGGTIATVTGALNVILDVSATSVTIGTGRSPEGTEIPMTMVQPALDLLASDGEVEVSPDAIGFRSAFCGAVLLTIPGVIRLGGTPPRVGWRPPRTIAAPSPEDRGAIRPWWVGRAAEFLWMEITDRADIGADLHCPQRDSADRANPGYSTILYVADGDVVVHYDRNRQAITSWSVARGPVEKAPTLWASHRGAVRRRLGTELREQPGWWMDLEGPFFIAPIELTALRARGPEILATISSVAPSGSPAYAPFYGYGGANELRPTQYYLNKLPRAVAELLPEVDLVGQPQAHQRNDGLGVPWREPWVTETQDRSRNVEIDLEVIERGLRGHVETEHALAVALRELGIEPRSPTASEPNFDLAWTHGATSYVAEVKSTTDRNEERQLRLGLGQVLRYRSVLSEALGRPVLAALVPERTPRDPTWETTCSGVGVMLLPRDQLAERLPGFIGTLPADD
jgi:hypothetical protein